MKASASLLNELSSVVLGSVVIIIKGRYVEFLNSMYLGCSSLLLKEGRSFSLTSDLPLSIYWTLTTSLSLNLPILDIVFLSATL